MKHDIALKWAAALRSGTYIQNPGSIRFRDLDGDSYVYSPLGVLCEISLQGSWDFDCYGSGDIASAENLPIFVKRWSGIRTPDGTFIDAEEHPGSSIAELGTSLSFHQIASIIETEWEKL